ncbi:hypothetical protein QFC19_002716 [Naganishia cerealis]|uniref:Uncharacterized protein n=1 Tax=Naganishia cerealis TaxID=610337 RepID=A0ACC2W919_9TREE|nr:hypothetical protein QFC19_002716 [Naganishia cerealis]
MMIESHGEALDIDDERSTSLSIELQWRKAIQAHPVGLLPSLLKDTLSDMAKSTRSGKQPAKQDPKKAPIQPAVFFAYPAGKAVPLDNSSLFEGKTFYVRCDFPDLYLAQFICDIEALGGSTNVADAWTADYIINNPPETDNQWQKDLRRRVQTEKECKSPIQRPYYWIYACHHAGEILSEEEMPKHPVFTKWDHSRRRPVPLLVYITVNLPRHGDESADDALCAAESLLESHGGLRSATRGHADVLLLNLTTASGKKFQAEAKPDQVIWSRTQFQDLAASSNSLDLGRDEEPHEIVVARTNARSVSAAAAGRRTIRKEFTAEDDDLVIRYIAAYDPEKKRMTSKSFYTELMNSRNPNLIPWVNRHTAESWRERVRKRISPFRLRIDAYIHERIDRSLCTREEREDGTFPAGLRREPEKEGSEAALPKSPIQADTLSAASTTGGTVREITTEKTASPDKSITKRKRQNSETVTGEIKNATVNKKQK